MAKSYFKIEGMNELKRSIDKLGKVPQKHVTASARKGMNIVLKSAKANAPIDTGALRKGIVMTGERSRNKGKKVYRLVFDSSMNNIFQKTSKTDKMVSGVNKKGKVTIRKIKAGTVNGYYPVSQEYGFFTKNGRFIPGFNFMHHALNNNAPTVQRVMITTMKSKIDAEIAKAGLK